jgi:MFS family permease
MSSKKLTPTEATSLINNDPTKPTPLPYPQFYVLLLIRIAEPLASNILFPFIVFMVKDFNIATSETEIGYYVGLIASSFAICQTFTSLPWGNYSDKVGRKTVIIMGLVGSGINLILFGLSKNLWWALITRSLSGALNGNIGVIRTMTGEMSDKSNRALAFSYLPMVAGLGGIFGAIVGGFLSKPAESLPWIFDNEFWRYYPYFLPCLVSGLLNLGNAVLAYFYLDETLKVSTGSDTETLIESSTLNSSSSTANNLQSSPPAPVDNTISITSKLIIVGGALLTLTGVIFNELIVLWSATDIPLGGLNFDHKDIAKALSLTGGVILIAQLVIYPRLQKTMGTLTLYRNIFPIYTLVCILIPMTNLFAKSNAQLLMWSSLLALIFIRAACHTISVTGINILLVESAEGKGNLGTLNGINQTLGGVSRSLGPAFTGIIYSYSLSNGFSFPFDFHLVWYLMALSAFACYLNSFKLHV